MADQSYANHGRFDPPLHFFVAPVLAINVLVVAGLTVHDWPVRSLLHLWLLVVSVALLVLAPVARMSALRAQDRLIRLEEMLRYGRLLEPETLASAQGLSLRQMIALRFASDAELPELMRRALGEGMTPKAIKQAITVWRADSHRV